MSLSQDCFVEHLASLDFQDGKDRGWWNIVEAPDIRWPLVIIWLAAPPRPNRSPQSPERFDLLFNLDGYPAKGPTACLWDRVKNCKLDKTLWPKGVGDVQKVFREVWEKVDCLYAPWDRIAAEHHQSDWAAAYPGQVWKPTRTIVHYLRLTRELLHSEDYHGV